MMGQPSRETGHERSSSSFRPLEGLRVIDLSRGLAGSFCTLLLADLGAEVIKVEWHAASRTSDNDIPFTALERNKQVWQLDLASDAGRAALLDLVCRADVAVESLSAAEATALDLGRDRFRNANASLIHCNLSAFGKSGPLADRVADDLIVQAMTGAMDITGEPDRPPVKMGIPLGEEISGLIAAIAILAKSEQSGTTGQGCFIDIAAFDANVAMLSYMANIYFSTGRSPKKLGSSHPTIFPYNAFKTRDSYIVAAPFTQIFWRKLCDVLGRNDLPANPAYKSFAERLKNRTELAAIIDAAFLENTTDEWRERLDRGDVPNGPVNTIGQALTMEQTIHRGMAPEVPAPGGATIRMLGSPFRFDFEGQATFAPRYALPERIDAPPAGWSGRTASLPDGNGAGAAPLRHVRVLDLTRMFAGPYCCLFMADLGAEVIKIEEPRIGDPTRRNIPMINGESTYFMAVNRGKKSVALDLKQPAARAAFLRLVAKADIVVENYRPGVMQRLGLSYDELRKAKSDIILLSLSGFGQTGPMRDSISFDIVNQAMAGVMSVTGEENRPPVRIGVPVGDLSGGIFGALALMAALRARRKSGLGACIDLSLHDLMLTLLGPMAQSYFSTGTSMSTIGSSDRAIVPSRAYKAADDWIAISAATDAQWTRLTEALACPELAQDARFKSVSGRLAHRSAIDTALERAVATRTAAEWIRALSVQGVSCARISSMGAAVDSEQCSARDMVLSYTQAIAGDCRGVGTALHVDGRLLTAELPPPALGQHTTEILRDIGGLSEHDLSQPGLERDPQPESATASTARAKERRAQGRQE